MRVLVTGSAGFIGFHVCKALLERGDEVLGVDNFNNYYDVNLKEARNSILEKYPNFHLLRGDLVNQDFIRTFFHDFQIDKVCHLAAQAGVRYSLENPQAYIQANLVAYTNLIEEVKNAGIKNFVYASSSSVYGGNKKIPFAEGDAVNNPISVYAASKRANELIANTYHHLYGMKCVGLRFFTVYGPWGRPDMAYFDFVKKIFSGEEIKIFNFGRDLKRDFTYIDDIVSGVVAAIDGDFEYEIFNLGNNKPVELGYFVDLIEKIVGKKAHKKLLPMQPGDVPETYADIDKSRKLLDFEPKTSIDEGLAEFVKWYKGYYSSEIG